MIGTCSETALSKVYTKNVTCVNLSAHAQETMQGHEPVSIVTAVLKKNTNNVKKIPHDTYMPENKTLLYNCNDTYDCLPVKFTSMKDLSRPNLILKSCYTKNHTLCETITFNNLSKTDKLLLLTKTIKEKSFYFVHCTIDSNSSQLCHEKDDDAYANLDHKANKALVSVFDEFICEEDKTINERETPRWKIGYDIPPNPCYRKKEDVDCNRTDISYGPKNVFGPLLTTLSTIRDPFSIIPLKSFRKENSAEIVEEITEETKKESKQESKEENKKASKENQKEESKEENKQENKEENKQENKEEEIKPKERVLLKLRGLLIYKNSNGALDIPNFTHQSSHELVRGRCGVVGNCDTVAQHTIKSPGQPGDDSLTHQSPDIAVENPSVDNPAVESPPIEKPEIKDPNLEEPNEKGTESKEIRKEELQ